MLETLEIEYDDYDNSVIAVYLNRESLPIVDSDNSPTGKQGMIKTVFVGEKYVVKTGGYMSEVGMYIDEEDRKYFAMVVYADIDGQWYVQERVDCVPFAEVSKDDLDTVLDLADKYEFDDVDFCYKSTKTRKFGHNFTKDRFGQVKIYDYEGG